MGLNMKGNTLIESRNFISHIDNKALLSYTSSLRDGQLCTLSPKFSVESFNFVRKVAFGDGVEWIARLRMPPIVNKDGEPSSAPSSERVRLEMESELATMEFVL